jgi:hypothetical protein
MSRVRIEIDFENPADRNDVLTLSVELEGPNPHATLERARKAAESCLPPEWKDGPEPTLKPGTYEMKINNVRFDDATQTFLFGQVASGVDAGKFQVRVSEAQRQPCGQTCQARDEDGNDESCSDTCAKPEGHSGNHETSDGGCIWAESAAPFVKKPRPNLCALVCDFGNCWESCTRPSGHDLGGCYCADPVHRKAME